MILRRKPQMLNKESSNRSSKMKETKCNYFYCVHAKSVIVRCDFILRYEARINALWGPTSASLAETPKLLNIIRLPEMHNEWFPTIGFLFYAQMILGSPGGKHGKLLEGNVWRKVVLTSKKPIFEGFGRFFAAILSDLDHVDTWGV